MKQEQGPDRVIIGEWMSLPPDKRRTAQKAAAVAARAVETLGIRCNGDRSQRALAWLLPCSGRA
jgi:hypothetical protein